MGAYLYAGQEPKAKCRRAGGRSFRCSFTAYPGDSYFRGTGILRYRDNVYSKYSFKVKYSCESETCLSSRGNIRRTRWKGVYPLD